MTIPSDMKVSEQLDRWLRGEGQKTVGGLIDVFDDKSFAILFVVFLGLPALPIPTGGATHVFEVMAVLLALELAAGRNEVWVPQRWRSIQLAGKRQQRFVTGLMRMIRWLEKHSRPRGRFLFHNRVSNFAFAMLVIAGCIAAFLAPPFTGLDTLPALGVVLLSLGVLLTDIVLVAAAAVVGTVGVALEIALGTVAIHAVGSLL